jgi:hypothetical protein
VQIETQVYQKNNTAWVMLFPRVFYTLPWNIQHLLFNRKSVSTDEQDASAKQSSYEDEDCIVGSTQVDFGTSISAAQRYQVGLSHIVSKDMTTGVQLMTEPSNRRQKASLNMRYDLSNHLRVFGGLSQERVWSQIRKKQMRCDGIVCNVSYSPSHDPSQTSLMHSFKPTRVHAGYVLNTYYSKYNVKLCKQVSSSL